MIDVERVSREIVRHLRGNRSQRGLSQRLQYTTNVVYLWESGQRYPTAATFFWLIHRTGGDVSAALQRFAPEWDQADQEPWKPPAIASLMQALKGRQTASGIARRLGRSRDAVGRWLRGVSEPRLPDFLRFVQVATTRMLDFISCFADPAALDASASAWRRLEAARKMTRELPWAPAVLLSLELEAYQQGPPREDDWIATRLDLPQETVSQCLHVLAEAVQIRRSRERWERVEVQAVDTRVPSRPNDLKQWWTAVARDRLPEADGTASFTICAVSQSDFERIQELQRLFYREVRALIAQSAPCERVVLLNIHTLALDRKEDSSSR